MNILLTIKLAIRGLLINKIRAFLTLLGIVIGVTGIIVIVAVGNGAQSLIVNQLSSIGTNLVGVLPGGGGDEGPPAALFGVVVTTLKSDDIHAIRDIPHVEAASGYNKQIDQIVFKNKKTEGTINGVFAEYPQVEDALIEDGRFFTTSEDASLARVMVLGSEVKTTLFGNSNPIGEKVKFRNQSFKIIGYFQERGVSGFNNNDTQVFIPSLTMQKLVLGINHISLARIKIDDPQYVDQTVEAITNTIRIRHGIDNPEDDDFSVRTQAQGLKIVGSVTDSIKLFLIAIAAIALIVGGIGIMNVMYISVTERTREIGLRKALGAQRKDILNQFLVEAVAITGLGGLIGIVLGVIISLIIALVIQYLGYEWSFIVDLESIVIAVGAIGSIGIIFGYAPASKASKKRAIEALRYE